MDVEARMWFVLNSEAAEAAQATFCHQTPAVQPGTKPTSPGQKTELTGASLGLRLDNVQVGAADFF